MMALGQGYLKGEGLPRDPGPAKHWLEQAEAHGVDSARFIRGRALLSGELPADTAGGLPIVASFAQSGNTLAMLAPGGAMRDRTTLPRAREAAASGDKHAMRAGSPPARPP